MRTVVLDGLLSPVIILDVKVGVSQAYLRRSTKL